VRAIAFIAAVLLCTMIAPRPANAEGGAPVIYSGTVTSNGVPASDFEVTLYQGDGLSPKFLQDRRFVVSARTEGDGAFVLVVPLEAVKDQVVTLRAKGYSPAPNGSGNEFVGGQSVLTGDANAVAGITISANAAVDFNYGIRNNRYARKSLFYVTDRARVSRAAGVQFANAAADQFHPTYGKYVGAVALGPSASPSGTCEGSTGWSCPGDLVRQNDSYVDTVTALPDADAEDAWIHAITASLPAGRRGRIMFYVHGFNNDFATAGATLARLAYETGQKADAGVLYSWPSAHKLSRYPQDLKTVDLSVNANLVRVLGKLAAIPNADVTIVGHSMGTFALTRALTQLAPHSSPAFAMLALFAGDLDVNAFRPELAGLHKTFGKIYVYSNGADQALRISQCLNGEAHPRIGQVPQTFAPPVRWYNATPFAPRAGLGHGYLASSLEVAADFSAAMNGMPLDDARSALRGLPWLGGVETAWSVDWGNIVGSVACEALKELT
jgi:esterase/lipase superfamily enzyme